LIAPFYRNVFAEKGRLLNISFSALWGKATALLSYFKNWRDARDCVLRRRIATDALAG
jgi:hypothetical protein